jgi:hypothetical protein
MKAYDIVLDWEWFKGWNPEIDCTKARLTALGMANRRQWGNIPEADHTSPLPSRGEVHTNVDGPPDIQPRRAMSLDHLLPSGAVVEAFAIKRGECQDILRT